MTVLSDPNRVLVWADIMRDTARVGTVGAMTKTDLRAAVDAADDWANSNASSYNTALPQPARTVLTAAQKAIVLMYVISKRQLSGS